MEVFVGTSGWSFPNWVGILYPEGLPQSKWLSYYSNFFNCVEVNSTFYRLFKPNTYRGWLKSVPDDFRFILKVPQIISHTKKLVNVQGDIEEFFTNIEVLKPKLGLLLLQLPPSFNTPVEYLEEPLNYLSSFCATAVEFRNWYAYTQDILNILLKYNCILVNPDSPTMPLELRLTNDKLYFRLHGRTSLHKSSYTDEELKEISLMIGELKDRINKAYVIFNNGVYGHSIPNAFKLQELLGMRIDRTKFLPTHSPKLGL